MFGIHVPIEELMASCGNIYGKVLMLAYLVDKTLETGLGELAARGKVRSGSMIGLSLFCAFSVLCFIWGCLKGVALKFKKKES